MKKFGYDFDMAIGTPALAARAGVVLHAEGSHLEGEVSETGNLGSLPPELHFSVQSCDPVLLGTQGCPTLPVTFRNTDPNPDGLHAGSVFRARPY